MKLPHLFSKSSNKEADLPTAGFEVNDSAVTIYIGNHEEAIPISEWSQGTEAIKELLEKASIAMGFMPHQALCAVSGFWSQGNLTVVKLTRHEAEKPIDKKELERIEKKLNGVATREAEANISPSFGANAPDLALVNSQKAFTKVDGFLSGDPLGLKGKTVEMGFFNAFIPLELAKILDKTFKERKVRLLTITDTLSTITAFYPEDLGKIEDLIILSEAGKSYDLAVVFGRNIIATRTLPLGRDFAAQNPDWFIKSLKETLLSFDGIKTFPSVIAVFGERIGIEERMASYPWQRTIPFQAPLQIVNITDCSLGKIFPKIAKSLST